MNIPISITFTLADLIWGTCVIVGIITLVYLLLVLRQTYKLLKSWFEFYNKNSEYIDVFVKDGSVIIHKAGVIAENIPDEPLTILDDFKGGFSVIQTLITMFLSFFTGNKKNN